MFKMRWSIIEIALLFHLQLSKPGWAQSGSDWSKRDKSGSFSVQNLVHFGSVIENVPYWNVIWKGPIFVPYGANLTQIGPKSASLFQTTHYK